VASLVYWLAVLAIAGIGYWLQASPKAEIEARRRLREWRKTSGTVTGARIEAIHQARLSIPGQLLKIKANVFKPLVHYSYQIGDKTYAASKFKNSFLSRGEEWVSAERRTVENIVGAHAPGQTVSVHYDPDDPAHAYLELDSSIARLFLFRISGMALILAAALMFMRSAYNSSGDMFANRSPEAFAAVLPMTNAELRAALAARMGLNCQYDGIYREAYESWLCRDASGASTARVYIYSRKQALDKTDYLTAQAEAAEAAAFFAKLGAATLPHQTDQLALQEWVNRSIPTLGQTGGRADTIINQIPVVLSALAENSIQLEVGELKY